MSDKPTGVFVRLPLSEDEARVFHKESSHAWDEFNGSSNALACEAGLFAIGTPVQGGKFDTVGWVAPELFTHFGKIPTGTVVSAVMTDSRTLPLVRQSDAQAQIAARDAEIVQKDRRIAELEGELSGFRAGLSELIAKEVADLKGGAE